MIKVPKRLSNFNYSWIHSKNSRKFDQVLYDSAKSVKKNFFLKIFLQENFKNLYLPLLSAKLMSIKR